MTAENTTMEQLLTIFLLENLITATACFKGATPICIDLTLASYTKHFIKPNALLRTIMKKAFAKVVQRLTFKAL